MRCAGAIKRALLANVDGGTEWYTAIEETEDYSFSEDSERRDLRDTEAERVYVFNTITYSDDSDDPDGGDCFMVTINEEL